MRTISRHSTTKLLLPLPHSSRHFTLWYLRRGFSTAARSPSSQPSSSSSGGGGGQWHHQGGSEEDSRGVVVRVWWDLENCQVPKSVDPHSVCHRIAAALRSHGIRGPLTITAFGDMLQLPNRTRDALCTTGICLYHVPNRGTNGAYRSILADLVSWVAQNPPPAHFFMISGDRDFADILHRLRMNNYNILIASNDGTSGALCSAATVMWHWNNLVRGDGIVGKYFNYPPDGQHSSWYGNFKGTLENPFSSLEVDTGLLLAAAGGNAAGEPRMRSIPMAFMNNISNILYSNPAGLSPHDLLREIKRRNVVLDKDYFGHKKFLNLIASMPHIAEVKPHPTVDGQHIVYSARSRSNEINLHQMGPIPGGSGHVNGEHIKNGEVDSLSSTLAEDEKLCSLPTDSVEECADVKDRDPTHLTPESDVVVLESSLKEANVVATKKHVIETPKGMGDNCANNNCITTSISGNSEIGISGEFSSRRLNSDLSDFPGHNPKIRETALPDIRLEGSKFEDFDSKDVDSHSNVTISSAPDASESTTRHGLIATLISGLHRRIQVWFNLSRALSEDSGSTSIDTDKRLNAPISDKTSSELPVKYVDAGFHPEPLDLFSKPGFWQSIATFLCSKKGGELVLNSKSRTHLVQNLKREGPSILVSLEEGHILHLVELLISDKKWIKECISQSNPFKPQGPSGKISMLTSAPQHVNLSCLFQSTKTNTDPKVANMQNVHCKSCQPIANSTNGGLETKIPKNFEELKIWYHKVLNMGEDIIPKDLNDIFERDFGKKLDSLAYGYSSVENLLAACSDTNNCVKIKATKVSSLSNEEIMSDCKRLISEILEKKPDGILLDIFRELFLMRYGYPIRYRRFGHTTLTSFIEEIPGIKVDSDMILPSRALSVVSSDNEQRDNQTSASCVEITGNAASENGCSSRDQLGHPNKCDVKIHDEINVAEKKLLFEEVSVSDEDASDAECCREIGTDVLEVPGNKQKGDETLLLQILESWHSGKESKENPMVQPTDSLADCSGKFGKHKDVLEVPGIKQKGNKTLMQQILEPRHSVKENKVKTQVQSIDGPVNCSGKSGKEHKDSMPSLSSSSKARPMKSYNFVATDESEKEVRVNIQS